LEVIGKEDVTLKEKQEQMTALDKKDALAVLPTNPWSIK